MGSWIVLFLYPVIQITSFGFFHLLFIKIPDHETVSTFCGHYYPIAI